MNRSTLSIAALALALLGVAAAIPAQTAARNPQRPKQRVEDVRKTKEVLRDAAKIDALLAMPGVRKEDIRKAMSHPQALSQTDNYLRSAGITPVPAYDTAGSAKLVREIANELRRDCAKIASRSCGDCADIWPRWRLLE